jgi:hypothetical protein
MHSQAPRARLHDMRVAARVDHANVVAHSLMAEQVKNSRQRGFPCSRQSSEQHDPVLDIHRCGVRDELSAQAERK